MKMNLILAFAALSSAVLGALAVSTRAADEKAAAAPKGPLDFVVKDIDGNDKNLADFKGKVVMIVNVASKCGNTPQYKPMEALYEKYKDKGFVIIGFPANNFRSQEPGTNAEIKEFCSATYHVAFPMMSKISVKGDDKAPLYHYLTEKDTAGEFSGEIDWNFAKYLVGRDGKIIARYPAKLSPDTDKVVAEIEKALDAPEPKADAK